MRNRHWIMNQGLDAARGQVRLQLAARGAAHDEEMVYVARIALRRHRDRSGRERRPIRARETTARVGPPAEARQARPQDRGLHLVEPRVDARLLVMVPV